MIKYKLKTKKYALLIKIQHFWVHESLDETGQADTLFLEAGDFLQVFEDYIDQSYKSIQ